MAEVSQKVEALRREINKRFDGVDKEIGDLKVAMGKKVNWSWFFGVLLTELALIAGIMGAMFSKIEAINENTYATREEVSWLKGKLEPFDFVTE